MSLSIPLQDVPSTTTWVELRQRGAVSWNVHVYNAGVYMQTGVGPAGGAIEWRGEVFRGPGLYSLDGIARPIDAVRVRAATTPTGSTDTPRVAMDAET